MPNRTRGPHDNGEDIRIRNDGRPWESLGTSDDLAQGLCREHLARVLERCDGDLLIAWVGQQVGSDNRVDY